jgi:EpsI family protein
VIRFLPWAPAALLLLGAIPSVGVDAQRSLPLRAELRLAVPETLLGLPGRDLELSEQEARVAGVSSYLLRTYGDTADAAGSVSLYVGYYERQERGKTIHSPRNCLPGAGWEALANQVSAIPAAGGEVHVNRYLLQRGQDQALVLYWYQGRGRVEANEYAVKWNLLRDAALHRRSDEALVRIVVPVTSSEEAAFERARAFAAPIIASVTAALPA